MKRIVLALFVGTLFAGCFVVSANAASVTFSSAVGLALTSPTTTLTIATGSVADLVTLNATSVSVSMSGGEIFALASPSYDLAVVTSSAGGAASRSCSSGVASVTLSQSTGQTNYTISPTDSQCSAPSNSGGGGSGGVSVGVPSAYGSPYIPGTGIIASSSASSSPASSTTSSISSSTSALQAQLNALLVELAALQAKAGESPLVSVSSTEVIFSRNLYFGITGNDVKELQLFLISQNVGPAARKLAAHGTTKNFATLTLSALIEFQKKAGIKPAVGYFGPITRAYVNNLMQ